MQNPADGQIPPHYSAEQELAKPATPANVKGEPHKSECLTDHATERTCEACKASEEPPAHVRRRDLAATIPRAVLVKHGGLV